jgi:hypothetical protein
MSEEATTTKGGRVQIQTGFHRTARGLIVSIKTQPEVEEFFATIADGKRVEVNSIGRLWMPLDKPLIAYSIPKEVGEYVNLNTSKQQYYSLQGLGNGLNYAVNRQDDTLNLSFIRLVGTSEGAGIEFRIKNAIFSLPALRNLRDFCAIAQKNFFVNYIRPVDLVISVQEV